MGTKSSIAKFERYGGTDPDALPADIYDESSFISDDERYERSRPSWIPPPRFFESDNDRHERSRLSWSSPDSPLRMTMMPRILEFDDNQLDSETLFEPPPVMPRLRRF